MRDGRARRRASKNWAEAARSECPKARARERRAEDESYKKVEFLRFFEPPGLRAGPSVHPRSAQPETERIGASLELCVGLNCCEPGRIGYCFVGSKPAGSKSNVTCGPPLGEASARAILRIASIFRLFREAPQLTTVRTVARAARAKVLCGEPQETPVDPADHGRPVVADISDPARCARGEAAVARGSAARHSKANRLYPKQSACLVSHYRVDTASKTPYGRPFIPRGNATGNRNRD